MLRPFSFKSALYLAAFALAGATMFNLVAKAKRMQEAGVRRNRRGVAFIPKPEGAFSTTVAERLLKNDLEGVKRLVLEGGDPNGQAFYGETLLGMAAGAGETELVKWLLAHGADARRINKFGANSLITALLTSPNSANVPQNPPVYPAEPSLSRQGAPSESSMFRLTCPPAAARKRGEKAFFESLDLLIAAGASVDSADAEGHTALYLATSDPATFLFFWNKGAKAHTPGDDVNTSVFYRAGADGLRAVVDKLLPRLSEATMEERVAMLAGALKYRRKELAALLIAKGCAQRDVSHPITLAVQAHYGEGLKMLKDAGAPLSETNLRRALTYAVRDGALNDAEALLKMGAAPNFTDEQGYTPLTRAISLSDADMAEALVRRGADMQTPDARGNSPADLATKKSGRLRALFATQREKRGGSSK